MEYWQKDHNNQPMSNTADRPKTMLIIKSPSAALTTVEHFLRNRGWKLYSTSNLKEAMVQLLQNKPTYVLICVDHPNKKVRTLPRILNQAFPVAVIVFADSQNSASYKLLNEATSDYRVYPPATGPAIERCVNKFLKDRQTRENMKSANNDFRVEGGANNGMISVKGGEFSSQFGGDAASRMLSQFLNDDLSATVSSSAKNDSGQIFAQPVEDDEPKTSD